MIYFTLVSAISKVDSKGRISIPIGLRAKLGLVEGSNVKIVLEKNRLVVTPDSKVRDGQSSVNGNIRGCEPLVSGSNPDSDPRKRGEFR